MIITCEKCSTSFNLDDSLIKETGSKVRCSQCKTVFTAFPASAPPLTPPTPPDFEKAEESPTGFEQQEDDFSFEEDGPAMDQDAADFEMDADLDAEGDTDFDFDDSGLSLEMESDEPDFDTEEIGTEPVPQELEMESGELGIEDTELEMEPPEDEAELDIADDAFTIEDSGLEIEPAEKIEEDGLSLELEEDDPGLTPLDDAPGLEMEEPESDFDEQEPIPALSGLGDEPSAEDDGIELDGGLSFESDDLSLQEDDGEIHGLELEMDDDDVGQDLEVDDEMEFYAVPDDDLEADDDGIEFEPLKDDDMEIDVQADEDDSLSLELEPDTSGQADTGLDSGLDIDEPSLSMDEDLDEDEFELEFDIEEDDSEAAVEDSAAEEGGFSPRDEDPPPVITPEDDFTEYDAVLDQETEPEDDLEEEETIEIEVTPEDDSEEPASPPPFAGGEDKEPTRDARRKRKKKSAVGTPVMVLLFLFVLVAGAYVASLMTGYHIPYLSDVKIPYLEKLLRKETPKAAEMKPVPNQKSVNGRFVTNSTAGTLFVITGKVENPSDNTVKHIRVKGSLFTQGNVEAKAKTAYCGNIIKEDILKTGNIADINRQLAVKAGTHNTNTDIKPGTSIQFMVVFSDLPEKLQNFIVKVDSFEKTN